MSDSLSLPKMKLISPEKKKQYYEKILSDTAPNNNNNNNNNKNNNNKNKLKNIQIKKKISINKKESIDNNQTTEAICNIIDLINDNNLNVFYKEDNSNFKRNIDQLNLKFYLETEKIISSNQNKTNKDDNYSINSNKLFLILFKQINLYIKEIERLNALMINSVKDTDNMKKKMAIFLRKQNDFETKEQLIQTLKYSVSSLEKKLSNVLISENNLRQEIQKLKKEKDFYYEYYKSSIMPNTNNKINNYINKSQTINDINKKNNNNNQHSKHNTKDNFFTNSKHIILLNDIQSNNNNNIFINDHKRNNSENDYPLNNNNNNNNNNIKKEPNLQKYYNGSPKRKTKNTINLKSTGNNNITGAKSIIRLCNYYSHNIEIDLPLGFKSKSPGKLQSNKNKDIHLVNNKKTGEKEKFQKSSVISENKLDLNIVNNNNNTFIFDNSFINRNKTIYNTINQNKDLSIDHLFKNKTNSSDSNYNINNTYEDEKSKNNKINSVIIKKDSYIKELDSDIDNLNNYENLLIEIKEYIQSNEKKNNINKTKNFTKNKSNSIKNSYNGKKK